MKKNSPQRKTIRKCRCRRPQPLPRMPMEIWNRKLRIRKWRLRFVIWNSCGGISTLRPRLKKRIHNNEARTTSQYNQHYQPSRETVYLFSNHPPKNILWTWTCQYLPLQLWSLRKATLKTMPSRIDRLIWLDSVQASLYSQRCGLLRLSRFSKDS